MLLLSGGLFVLRRRRQKRAGAASALSGAVALDDKPEAAKIAPAKEQLPIPGTLPGVEPTPKAGDVVGAFAPAATRL